MLGGYTTFSSFTVETLALIETGRWTASGVYLVGSVLLGLAGAYLGIVLAREYEVSHGNRRHGDKGDRLPR